jgi:hypothetical protein
MRYASLCLVVFGALPVLATTITTTSFATWESAAYITGSPTFVDAETLPPGHYNTAAGVTEGSYIFTGPDGSNWSLGVNTFGGNTTGLFGGSDGVGAVEATLPGSGQAAVFFYTNTIKNNALSNGTLTLTLSDGETFLISSGQFGLSVSHPITSFSLATSSGQAPFLEWAYFANSSLPQDGGGGTAQTPEAVTLALVGGGMLVLFGSKRKLVDRFIS